MSSSIPRPMMFLAGAAIAVGSFFITLKVLDDRDDRSRARSRSPLTRRRQLPHLKVGQRIDYNHGLTDTALLSGWGGPQKGGIWSVGNAVFIGFIVENCAGATAPKQIILHAGIFLSGTLTGQHVQVWSGDEKLAEFDLKTQPPELTVPLGRLNVSNGEPVILGFYLPDAKPVKDVDGNSQDPRALGLRIYSL